MSGIGSTRQSVATSSFVGGVKDWQNKFPSDISSGLGSVTEYRASVAPQPQYPAEWRPEQRTVLPTPSHPGHYYRASLLSPRLPEGYSDVGVVLAMMVDIGVSCRVGRTSYVAHIQELHDRLGEWLHEGVARQVRHVETPVGRMIPKLG